MSTSEAAALPHPVVVETDPTATFSNSSVAGINRVLTLDAETLLVNNIGRNCELRQVLPSGETRQRAVFNTTLFPGQDFPSIFDVDAHAAFLVDGGETLLLCNHYGLVRYFDLSAGEQSLQTAASVSLPGDTERILLVHGCLIASSPRGQYTPDAARPGILISEPLPSLREARNAAPQLAYRSELMQWDAVTALAVDAAGDRLAVGARGQVGVFGLRKDGTSVRLGAELWLASIPYLPQWLQFDGAGRLLVAGYDASLDDPEGTDWDSLGGGGLDVYSSAGELLSRTPQPETTAWGYGADPIVPALDEGRLYVIDRSAGLHAVDIATGAAQRLYNPPPGCEGRSLGIGHADRIGNSIFAGYSRDAYRLFRFDV